MADFEGQWPVPRFHFQVTIDGEEYSFQEVTGLEAETQEIEYRHGDSEFFNFMKIPGLIKTPRLVCRKGIFSDDDRLLELFTNLEEEKEYYDSEDETRFDIVVELLNETGETVKTWSIERAFPVKYSTPGLKSDANEIAIEEMVFAYERIVVTLDG